ncbi:MAG: hypothetical protein GYA55_11455 [SAR324 cluster bacterium]|uniref:CARDB domain-containing protein n=1 Tax=SAR324 cluster bacterium TaxID=2024889 RepID=A0A7X9FT40_9DELT|nr:hypothetical protein [SAR324 cluster bacterium]
MLLKVILKLAIFIFTLLPSALFANADLCTVSVERVSGDWNSGLRVRIRNNGESGIKEIKTTINFHGNDLTLPLLDSLSAKEEKVFELAPKYIPNKSGKYPVILRTRFLDEDSSSYNTLSVKLLEFGDTRYSRIFGKIDSSGSAGKYNFKLSLKNLEIKDKTVFLRALSEDPVQVDPNSFSVNLKGDSSIHIQEFGVRVPLGSLYRNYPIFVVAEVDEEQYHDSLLLTSDVQRKMPELSVLWFWALIFFLSVSFCISVILEYRGNLETNSKLRFWS